MRRRQFLALPAALIVSAASAPTNNREASMRETIIQTRTINMSIVDAGKGPLILLCHGFPETKHAWRHQLEALAEAGYRAVAPDMRGYGGDVTVIPCDERLR